MGRRKGNTKERTCTTTWRKWKEKVGRSATA
jgi:hypothetical protein